MHRKLAIIDDCYVWVDSTNWTVNDFDVIDEENIKIGKPEIATLLKGQCIMDWKSIDRTQDVMTLQGHNGIKQTIKESEIPKI